MRIFSSRAQIEAAVVDRDEAADIIVESVVRVLF
jgi:hypothetical protein